MSERPRPPHPVTLEDLLHLKRSERPSSEFWSAFDAELRRKQLSAIVSRRPWWRTFRGVAAKLAWISIPAGTAAVFAFSLGVGRVSQSQPAPASKDAVSVADAEGGVRREETIVTASFTQQSGSVARSVREVAGALPQPAREAVAQDNQGQRENGTDVAFVSGSVAPVSVIAGRFDHLSSNITDDNARVFAVASLSNAGAVSEESNSTIALAASKVLDEPLAHITSPREARRARLLAQLSDASSVPTESVRVARSRERITNHLNDQALYDSITRLGLNGDSLSIKF